MNTRMNGSETLQKTVRSFWEGVNWENRPLAVPSSGFEGIAPVLSLKLTVKDYFKMISWAGIAVAAAPTPPPSLVKPDGKKETLEDFLDDISSFF